MKVAQVPSKGAAFEIVERPIPKPGPQQVLIKVEACGVCHSDMFVKEGYWDPPIQYPRVPGHEVIGKIAKLGEGVTHLKEGQRVGVGWEGGHCFTCDPCKKGDFITCSNQRITGISHDGGYGEYFVSPVESIAIVPDGLEPEIAGPIMCAGVTVFGALRTSGARIGDVVAVQGIGGLGHLAIQYASKAGYKTVALSHGASKKDLALKLGAHVYIDTATQNAVEELKKLGGANVIIATVPNAEAISPLVDGLANGGNLVVVGADTRHVKVTPIQLLARRLRISGWPSGTAKDSQDALEFSLLNKVYPMVETFKLEDVSKAYEKMISNTARFRTVLVFK
eukprot:TRINITY_DN1464_c0_g1_i1.p1 TRINITY_DN1464_c0_g1~~TRINITY_DN1464_c0_g1_i1.p1  ORF type:complete len:357 (-),score=73.29 TRINITY_DN1464_c0_g1_i1:25-1035(-)